MVLQVSGLAREFPFGGHVPGTELWQVITEMNETKFAVRAKVPLHFFCPSAQTSERSQLYEERGKEHLPD